MSAEPVDYLAAAIELLAVLRMDGRDDPYATGWDAALRRVGALLGDALAQACGAPAGEVGTSKVLASRAAELAQIRTGTVPTPQEGR